MNNTVTQEQIDKLLNEADVDIKTIFGKVTVVTVRLTNGFTVVKSSACVDPTNYSEEMGAQICLGKIKDDLWQLEGYLLQNKLHNEGVL
ncbi:Gp49 family protein [Priestia aryabhattai]|uniref:Gp49 family protein n=1 Tax=Priestia aryabhattai TaxID=412384 RepID=UPI0039A12E9F